MIVILILFSLIVCLITNSFVSGIYSRLAITIFSGFSFWVLFFWYLLGVVSFAVDCKDIVYSELGETEEVIVTTGFLTPLLVFIIFNLCILIIKKYSKQRPKKSNILKRCGRVRLFTEF